MAGHPVFVSGRDVWLDRRRRGDGLDQVGAALVQLAGEPHAQRQRLARVVGRRYLRNDFGDPGLFVHHLQQGQDQPALRPERVVDRLLHDAGLDGDLGHRCRGIAALCKQPPRRREDELSGLGGLGLASGAAGLDRVFHWMHTPITGRIF